MKIKRSVKIQVT